MSTETVRAKRLNPILGAEISGVDLSQPLSNSEVAALHDALHAHQVIFFRNKSPIDPGALVRLGRHFGELHAHVMGGLPDHPEVRRLHADETSKHVAGEDWHTDSTCDPIPPLGSILYLHTLPLLGGDTIFASMYAAYDALSPRMKEHLSGLTATHDGGLVFNRFSKDKKYPVSVHPVITGHPLLHLAYQRVAGAGEQGDTRLSLRSSGEPALSDALPLGAAFDRILGQSLHAALRRVGLLSGGAIGLSGADRRAETDCCVRESNSASRPLSRRRAFT
jgi:alpha-ketoglutarate-dependent taurine dioxygenase